MKYVILAVAALALVACQGVPGGGMSPGTDSAATAAGGFGAQTVTGGQGQGQTPQDVQGGMATQNWHFASDTPSNVQMEIMALAKEKNWTAEEIVSALQATNGAPENVTITTGNMELGGGNADAVGSTAGQGGSTPPPNPTQP